MWRRSLSYGGAVPIIDLKQSVESQFVLNSSTHMKPIGFMEQGFDMGFSVCC